uniref:tetratricopeptide repeat-containing sensor histidine kinase n=1 Tax=uncultured Draconibacterium sp. TaxID=1573823 RepID=UPI003216A4DF
MRPSLKKIFFFFCAITLYGTVTCSAQNNEIHLIDSLKNVNKLESDQNIIVDNINQIAYLFGEHFIDSSFVYLDRSILLANNIAYKEGAAKAYYYKARAMIQIGMVIEAIENYKKSLALYTELKDSTNILYNYRGLGLAYSHCESQLEGLDYNLKTLALAEKLKDSMSLAVAYNNIAADYNKLDNYELSLFYLDKTLALDIHHQNKENIATTYVNLGILKLENQRLEEATSDFLQVQSLLADIDNIYVKSYLYISLARYYIAIKKYDSAEHYINQATTICKKQQFNHILVRAYHTKGEILFDQNEYKKCIVYLDKCLELSKSINIFNKFPKIYNLKAQAYSQLGDYEKAYLNSEQANHYATSAQTKKASIALAEFDKEQKIKLEKELLTQQAENTQIKLQFKYKLALIFSISLLLSGLLFIYLFLRLRNKNNALKEQHNLINRQKNVIEENFEKLQENEQKLHKLNASKDKLFSIIAHDLRSPFNAILGFSNELTQSYDEYDNNQRKEMISVISASSESTLFLLENLLNWARSQSECIKTRKELHDLKSLINESIIPYIGSAELKNLNILNSIPESIKIKADKETCKVVISNLFSNAVKFSNRKDTIKIWHKLNKKAVSVCIADSGIGMCKKIVDGLFNFETNTQRPGTSNEKGTGLGLILCREFILLNDGEIWAESEEGKGSSFYFSLPLASNS